MLSWAYVLHELEGPCSELVLREHHDSTFIVNTITCITSILINIRLS
jgi:hypothetical protein